ncbi:MAG: DUF2330 domain-containing protein [bacterium]|nr:DUF2330 domain-containing protein [bacterium]
MTQYIHHNLVSWFMPFEHFSHGHILVGSLSVLFWLAIVYFVFSLFIKGRSFQGKILGLPATALVVSLLSFASVAWAMCPMGFVPPGRIYHPDNNTRGLLVFDGALEKLILEPSFTGNAKQFGLVMPTPSRPELNEAPEKIFQELEDLTNPIVQRGFGLESAPSAQSVSGGVVVIEQKDVGDYSATVLTANSAAALIEWLNANGYKYNPNDEQNFSYYVQKGGFYFVALKVNMEKAKVDANGFLSGRLRPIEFAFAVSKPMLPLRSMAGDMESMNFTLYALADTAYYIPGSEILYSKILATEDINKVPSLNSYQGLGKWLVRNNVLFDPRRIGEDLQLLNGGTKLIITSVNARRRVNPQLTPEKSGVLEIKTSRAAYVGGGEATATSEPFARSLSRGSAGNDVRLLQIILRDTPGVYPEGLVTGYFGSLTYKAVVKFQESNRQKILTPINLSVGTGYVGAATRSALNQTVSLTN